MDFKIWHRSSIEDGSARPGGTGLAETASVIERELSVDIHLRISRIKGWHPSARRPDDRRQLPTAEFRIA